MAQDGADNASASGAVAGPILQGWMATEVSTTLSDGSRLNEYRAVTEDIDGGGALLAIDFFPRFGCEPAWVLEVPQTSLQLVPADDSRLSLALDGNSVAWPVTTDVVGDVVVIYHAGKSDAQQDLWTLSDRSNRAVVQPPEGQALEFSLIGSRQTTREAHQRCLAHEADEWTPVGADAARATGQASD